MIAGNKGDLGFPLNDVLSFKDLEHRVGNLRIVRDFFQRESHDQRRIGAGFGEFDGRLALGGAGDDVDLIGRHPA